MSQVAEHPARTDTDWIQAETLSNGRIAVSTDRLNAIIASDGSIESLKDAKGREYTQGEFNKLRLFRDVPGNYDAWDILPTYRETELPFLVDAPIMEKRRNGETAVFACVLKTEKSRFVRTLRFFREQGIIEVEHQVSWHEDHVLAKTEFACNVRTPYALCDTSAGYIVRETNRNTSWQQARYEVCQHKWCDLSETSGGVAIINDGKYGVGLWENVISLSLLRATCRPDLLSDRGEHAFAYLIVPHTGTAQEDGINRLALEYNTPLLKADVPSLALPEMGSLFLQSLKQSEDEKKLVLRLTEQDGRRGEIRFPFPVTVSNLLEDEEEETDMIAYGPFEMLTLCVDPDKVRAWLK